MDRRKFLTWVGIGGIATYLPIAIAACSPQTDTSTNNPNTNPTPNSEPTSTGDEFVEIGSITDLDAEGQIFKKANDVIVFRDPQTSELVAISSVCTHKGCDVEWKANDKNLFCPCHDSFFDKDGKVITGPATQPLEVYEVKEEKGSVFVKLA